MAAVNCLKRMSRMTPEELKKVFGLSELPASAGTLDPKNLPWETLEEFSYDGLGFEESATQLWQHLTIMHYHAGTYNRHSEFFPIACAALEKDIQLAGSYCLTKTVLEQKGHQFPGLENLTIEALYGLTSYYFRKCGKAFDDLYSTAGLISIQMHQWEVRWYTLGERLKATQEKIEKIIDKKINVDSILKRSEMYKSEKPASDPGSDNAGTKEPSSLVLMHGALPMLGSYARQILGERKKEAHDEKIRKQFAQLIQKSEQLRAECEQKEQKKAADKTGKNSSAKSGSQPEQSGQNKKSEQTEQPKQTKQTEQSGQNNGPEKETELTPVQKEIRETGCTITELRLSLIREAGVRGEGDQVMQIAADPPEKLLERWKRYFRPEKEKNSDEHYKRKKAKKKFRR